MRVAYKTTGKKQFWDNKGRTLEKWKKSRQKSRRGVENRVNSGVYLSVWSQEGEINDSEGDGSIGVTLMGAE